MEPSSEIVAVFQRLLRHLMAGDDGAVHTLISRSPSVRMVLTGEDEWWQGHEEIVQMARLRFEESGIVRSEFERIEGYESEQAAWVVAKVINHPRSGRPFVLRHVAVFALEAGAWRTELWHVSSPTPNVEVFGHEMPKSLGDLVESYEESPDQLHRVAPSGTVTVMFTDVVDSTIAAERLGDARWVDVMSDHFETVRRLIERRGGTIVKTLGDGTMSAFGSAGDAVLAAVDLQREMQGQEFELRIGLHSGDSLRREGDYYGVAVNKAARIGAAAGPGEILVSAVTAELARGQGVEYGPARTVTLKGIEGTHAIHGVRWT
jgi:adenylate cyclase